MTGVKFGKRGFCPADLADHDAVRSQAEGMTEQGPHGHLTCPFCVRWASLQANHMTAQTELGSIFDGHNALIAPYFLRQHIEQRCFAGAGAARNQQVHPFPDGCP